MNVILGILCAVVLHAVFIFGGGLIFGSEKEDHGSLAEVELLSEDSQAEEKEEETPPEQPEIETETEQPPDAAEIMKNLDQPVADDAPAALDAASLSAIEAALSGQGGGGEFTQGLSFASGVVGGKGVRGGGDDEFEGAFSLSEIDQKPRAVFQTSPIFPSEMRGKKVEGVVTVVFVVDASGKVADPRIESTTHPAFERPAADAVKKWKFEAAVKGGKRVACKMRVPIRFQPS